MQYSQMLTGSALQKFCQALAWLLVLVFTSANVAAQSGDTAPPRGQQQQQQATDSAPKCVHGCQRWGKMCNVDPRGVYKCRRRCEKFGKICE